MPGQTGRKKKKAVQAGRTVAPARAAKRASPQSGDGDKFATLFRSMRQGVFYQAADGRLIDVNPAALRMFGVSRREFLRRDSLHPAWRVVGEDGAPLLGPSHPSMIALRTGKPVKDLVVGVTHAQSGETVWLSANAIPEFRRGETKPYRVAVTLHDLTAVKQAEKDLRESRDRFQSLFRNIREAVAVYDAIDDGRDFVFRDFNPAAEAIEHVRRADVIGRKVTDVFPGVEEFGLLDVLRRVWASGRTESFPARIYKDARDPGTWRENEVYRLPSGEVVALYRDITEQRRTEAALRESEDKFKYVFDHSIIGKSFTLPNGEIQVNAAFCRMLGYAPDELQNLKWIDITHPDDIALTQEHIDALLSGKQDSARFTKRYLHKDGRPVWTDVSTSIRRDEKGRPLYFITTISDITEQVRVHEALNESERRYRELITSMREMVVLHELVHDAEGRPRDYRILDCNPAFTEIMGIPRDRVVGKLATEAYGVPDAPYLDIYAEVARDGRPAVFEDFFAPMGKHFHVSCFRPSPGRFATVTTDITERKQIEEALRQGEREFRSLAESMPQIVWVTRPDGWNIYFNQRWVDYTGQTLEESYGHGWNRPFHPDDQQRAWEAWQNATRHGATYSLECRLRRADGAYRWWLIRGVPLTDAGGNILKWFGTCTDIDNIKQAEQKLRESEARLREVLDATPFPIALVDAQDDKIEFWSRSALALFGHIAPTAPEWYNLAYPDPDYRREVIERWKAYLDVARRAEGAVNTGEYRITCRDGSVRICELYAAFLADRLVVIFNDITAHKAADERVMQSLREKETLLREIYHRTKNNMNVIASMLSLRARAAAEPAAAAVCRDVQDRIRSMALVHQKLYESRDLSSIDLKDYIAALAANLVESNAAQAAGLRVESDLEPVVAPIDIAIPCGMILNELFSNAFKHAFPGGRAGTIRLRLRRAGKDGAEIVFSDDGVGVPDGFDSRAQAGLGLRTLFMLVEHQLQGSVAFEGGAGLTCRIRFAVKPPGTEAPS